MFASSLRKAALASVVVAGTFVGGTATAVADPIEIPLNLPIEIPGFPTKIVLETLPTGQVAATLQGPNFAPATPAAPEVTLGDKVIEIAKTKLGRPYIYGAAGPNAFDCSGLVQWAHAQAGVTVPRVSYAQIAGGQRIARADLQPGDVVAFYSGASHVGLYIGDGQVIHAPQSGVPISIAPLASMPFYGATRYV